jgi:hypothetical protein
MDRQTFGDRSKLLAAAGWSLTAEFMFEKLPDQRHEGRAAAEPVSRCSPPRGTDPSPAIGEACSSVAVHREVIRAGSSLVSKQARS